MFKLFSLACCVPKCSSKPPNKSIAMGIKTFNRVSHVIFDMDGLLLDTEHIYEDVVRDIAKSFGKDYPMSVRLKLMGTTDQISAKIAIEGMGLPISIDEYLVRHKEMCRQRFQHVKLMPGAERLINHLHQNNVPFALATSSGKEMAALKMHNYMHLFKLFSHHVMGSTDPEVKNGKPAPDIFLIAANRFPDKPAPNQCLVFEDSPAGVQAARAADMQVVMVPDKIVNEERRQGATLVVDSLNDFQPELFGLPSFK